MKIMVLGFSSVGKTHYLGSLYKMRYDLGPRGITLQNNDLLSGNPLDEAYNDMIYKSHPLASTTGLKYSSMILTKGMDEILDLSITDVEGQALDPNFSNDVSKKLIDEINDYDGLIFVVKAPATPQEADKCKAELGQMLSFARESLKGNGGIPMTLVLNQIDSLPGLQRVSTDMRKALENLEEEIEKKYNGNNAEIEKQIRTRKGSIINRFVKPSINTRAIYQVMDTFFKFIRTTKFSIPNKVFPCTSFGFLGENKSQNLAAYLKETGEIYQPYGGAASFLWILYARLNTLPKVKLTQILSKDFTDLNNDLLEDIRDLNISGRAYFDPDEDSSSQNNLWSLRNIANIDSHKIQA